MRGITAVFPAKSKFKTIFPIKSRWAALSPQKSTNKDFEEGKITNEAEPIVAFCRPPPPPPVLGPLVALSLLDTWWNRDSSNN